MRRPTLPVLVLPVLVLPILVVSSLAVSPVAASDVPACALSGSVSVMIGGKPALRLADVAGCPAELIRIIPGIQIDGQPMVHVETGSAGNTRCTAKGERTVSAGDTDAQGLGDVDCRKPVQDP